MTTTVRGARETEEQFGQRIKRFAEAHGWTYAYHTHRSQFSAAGYPDWHLIHPLWQRQLYAELKREVPLWQDTPDKLSWEQRAWLVLLRHLGHLTFVWRPSDWPQIEQVLSNRPCVWMDLPIMGHTNPGEWDGKLTPDELALGPRGYNDLRLMQTGRGRIYGKRRKTA